MLALLLFKCQHRHCVWAECYKDAGNIIITIKPTVQKFKMVNKIHRSQNKQTNKQTTDSKIICEAVEYQNCCKKNTINIIKIAKQQFN